MAEHVTARKHGGLSELPATAICGNDITSSCLYVSALAIITAREVPPRLKKDLKFLDEAYPEIDIEFVVQHGKFGPKLIQELSKEWNVPTNFMFIGSPGDHFLYGLAELGGVRLIV